MGDNSYKGTIIVVILIAGIWIWSLYGDIKELKNENFYLQDSLSSYQYALEEANNNIDEANSIIEDAQNYAWANYEEMGYALENLYTVDTISEP